MRKLDRGAGRQVGGRARRFDELRQPGNVVGLDVRLEHGHDRRPDALPFGQVALDQRLVRVDDRQPRLRQTAEQVRGASRLVVEERTQDHSSSVKPACESR